MHIETQTLELISSCTFACELPVNVCAFLSVCNCYTVLYVCIPTDVVSTTSKRKYFTGDAASTSGTLSLSFCVFAMAIITLSQQNTMATRRTMTTTTCNGMNNGGNGYRHGRTLCVRVLSASSANLLYTQGVIQGACSIARARVHYCDGSARIWCF